MKDLRAWWEYVSNNRLLVALIVAAFGAGGGALWLAVKRAGSWLTSDADVSWLGVLILSLVIAAALVVICVLAAALRRKPPIRAATREPQVTPKENPRVATAAAPAPTSPVVTSEPRLPEPVVATGPPGPSLPTGAGLAPPPLELTDTRAAVPAPVELSAAEAAVMRWCGHQWQPGVPVGIARGALELGMSSLQVASAVDKLHAKGLVSKVGPNGVSLTPAGRDLCEERKWHGGREKALRSDPRAPYLR